VTRGGTEVEPESVSEDRPLRRDAELNLARIVVAARDVFSEHGYDASMEQIATRADVGIGTLYRRFPTKADLCAAVMESANDRTRQIAEAVLAETEPGKAVFEFVRRCVAAPSCWRAMTSQRSWSGDGAHRAVSALLPVMARLLTESQDAGTVRDDIVPTDLVVLLMSVRAVADRCDAEAPDTSLRFLDLALDGLRPGGRSPGRDPMTPKQLIRVLGSD
jgi:AcrR family transcriptional regulator